MVDLGTGPMGTKQKADAATISELETGPLREETDIDWDFPNAFIYEVIVAPTHIDEFQHTNNVVYLTWMAKTAWEHSKALGLDFAAYRAINRGMVVRRHELDYIAPSHEGDRVKIGTWITGNDAKLRLRRRFQMVNAATSKTLLRGLSDFICVNIETGKPTRMPESFVTAYALTGPEEKISEA